MSTETPSADAPPTNEASLPVRAVWYLFVGWWASGFWLTIAWTLNLTIIGTPLGIKMINMVPKVLSLKERELVDADGSGGEQKYSLPIRAVYFILIGWWASGLWMALAYVVSLTIIGLPSQSGCTTTSPSSSPSTNTNPPTPPRTTPAQGRLRENKQMGD